MTPPSLYPPDVVVELLCRLIRGRSLHSVCADPDMPGEATVRRWARRDRVFADHLAAARPRGPGMRAPGRPRAASTYSEAIARGICAALAEGFPLEQICASPAVPVGTQGVHYWIRTRPQFAAAYAEATRPRPGPRGLVIGRGRLGGYTPQRAKAFIDRLLQGRSMRSICRDPDMPGTATIQEWRRRHMDFHLAIEEARRFQLDLLLDDILADADAGRRPSLRARRIVNGLTRYGMLPYAAGRPHRDEPPPTAPEPAGPGIGHNSQAR